MKSMQSIWRLASYRPGVYLTSGLLAGTVFYLFPLVPGLIVQQIFDSLTNSTPAALNTWSLITLLIASIVVRIGTLFVSVSAEVTLGQTCSTLLRCNLFARVLERPGARPLPASAGEAISRFRDDTTEVSNFVCWTFDPFGQIIVMVVALVILIRISPLITLAVFVPLLGVLAFFNLVSKRIEKYRRANQESIGEVTGLLGEVFGAVQAVKLACAETHVVDHFRTINETRRKAALRDRLLTQVLSSVSTNAADLGTGLLLLVAAQAMQSKSFSVGDFALFVSYLGWLSQVTTMSGGFLTKYRQMGVSMKRLTELLQGSPPEMLVQHSSTYLSGALPELPHNAKTASHHFDGLEVEGLSYRYPASERGIESINLHLRRGMFTVITGRIGSGKTTFLRVMLGLLPQDSGSIYWNGKAVEEPASFFVAPRSAYTPQVPRLFSQSLKDNILLGLPEKVVNLPAALRAAVLERDIVELEQQLETLVGPRGVKLSGGQMQRTAAARMFVRDAELLVVDDLSSALDVETEQLLWERIAQQPGVTCLAVSHRRATLRDADHIIVLKEGKVEAEGRLDDLLERCEEMQRLWHGELEAEA